MLPVQSPLAKIFPFPFDPNHFYIPRCPIPHKGRIAIVTDAGLDAMDAGGASDEGAVLRTAKPCGPDTPTLVSSSREASFLGTTVARKPGHRGERGISRKTIAQETPGVPVCLW
jgi:hypothetical protein